VDTRRILIVDDNVDAAETLAELLRVLGYDVRCAHHPEAALDTLESYAAELALLDIGLPGQDGYQLAAAIRQRPIGQAIKLVALTGYGADEDRARALAAGFDDHLVKPVDPGRLMQLLNQLLP